MFIELGLLHTDGLEIFGFTQKHLISQSNSNSFGTEEVTKNFSRQNFGTKLYR
jgi:hypothetical protein